MIPFARRDRSSKKKKDGCMHPPLFYIRSRARQDAIFGCALMICQTC